MATTSKTGLRPIIYQLEADDLERIITRVVTDAMERYTSTLSATPAAESNELMTVAEVCAYLHVTKPTLNTWHKCGYLTRQKVGRRVLYSRATVEDFALNNNGKSTNRQ